MHQVHRGKYIQKGEILAAHISNKDRRVENSFFWGVVPTGLRKQWETCSIEPPQRLSSPVFSMGKGAQVRLKSYCLYLILRRGRHPACFSLK